MYKREKQSHTSPPSNVKRVESSASIQEKIGPRVMERLKPRLSAIGYQGLPAEIALIAFKDTRMLEVYVKDDSGYKLLTSYPFTAFSGKLGPKLREGDGQIPEGIYKIEYLNPNSAYYLSMKINYPNAFDRAKGELEGRKNLGGDIFIHGKALTIGCIPVGDVAIEELFILAYHALHKEIKVIISPQDFRLNPEFSLEDRPVWCGELYEAIRKEIVNMKITGTNNRKPDQV